MTPKGVLCVYTFFSENCDCNKSGNWWWRHTEGSLHVSFRQDSLVDKYEGGPPESVPKVYLFQISHKVLESFPFSEKENLNKQDTRDFKTARTKILEFLIYSCAFVYACTFSAKISNRLWALWFIQRLVVNFLFWTIYLIEVRNACFVFWTFPVNCSSNWF